MLSKDLEMDLDFHAAIEAWNQHRPRRWLAKYGGYTVCGSCVDKDLVKQHAKLVKKATQILRGRHPIE